MYSQISKFQSFKFDNLRFKVPELLHFKILCRQQIPRAQKCKLSTLRSFKIKHAKISVRTISDFPRFEIIICATNNIFEQ